jgi:hypothetical protein
VRGREVEKVREIEEGGRVIGAEMKELKNERMKE